MDKAMTADTHALLYLLLAVAWCSAGTGVVELEWIGFVVDNAVTP